MRERWRAVGRGSSAARHSKQLPRASCDSNDGRRRLECPSPESAALFEDGELQRGRTWLAEFDRLRLQSREVEPWWHQRPRRVAAVPRSRVAAAVESAVLQTHELAADHVVDRKPHAATDWEVERDLGVRLRGIASA